MLSTARRAWSRAGPARAARSCETGLAPARGDARDARLGEWVLIERRRTPPRELEWPRRPRLGGRAPGRRAPRPTCRRCCRRRATTSAANKAGSTEIWICSDLRENDWDADERPLAGAPRRVPRVPAGRPLPPARLPAGRAREPLGARDRRPAPQDGRRRRAARLAPIGREKGAATAGRPSPSSSRSTGARSETTVEMTGPRYDLKDHRDPARERTEGGAGARCRSRPTPTRPTTTSTSSSTSPRPAAPSSWPRTPEAVRPLQLAAAIAPDAGAHVLGRGDRARAARPRRVGQVSLLIWQAPLPEGDAAELVQAFVDRGGQVIFFPPRSPGDGEASRRALDLAGATTAKEVAVENWRGDQDLLAHTQSGAALPVGRTRGAAVLRARRASSRRWPRLRGGRPLLARVPTDRGGVYFCATTPGRRPIRRSPPTASSSTSWSSGPSRPGRCGPGADAAARRGRPRAASSPRPGRDSPAADEAVSTDTRSTRGLRRGRAPAGREPPRGRGRRPGPGRRPRRRAVPRARLRAGRRPGRQRRLA